MSKFIKIKPTDVIVDHEIQRTLDRRRVETQAANYQPDLIGVPVVVRRADGTLSVADGQHRIAFAIAAGHGDVAILMEVHEGMSAQEEASLFLRLNGGRKAVQAIDKYKTRLVALDPTALEIRAILKRTGCRVAPTKLRGAVSAVEAVEGAYHKGTLEKTMQALMGWLEGDPAALERHFIKAVSAFFALCPEAEAPHLASRLTPVSTERLSNQLKRERQVASHDEAARSVLTEIYNRRTPQHRRVSWRRGTDQPIAEA